MSSSQHIRATMESAKNFHLTRTRLKNLKRRVSLKEITSQYIINNLKHYIGYESRNLADLSPPARRDVLQTLTNLKCKNDESEAIGTHSLNLDNLLTFCPIYLTDSFLQKFLEDIVRHAPDLQSLRARVEMAFGQICIEKPALASICQLKNLTKLELSPVFYQDVMMICNSLRKLEHLDVSTPSPCQSIGDNLDEFVSTFGLLKVFLFRGDAICTCLPDSLTFEDHLYTLCIEHLPNLEVVRNYAETLKHLYTRPAVRDWTSTFPDVTNLKICPELHDENSNDQIEAMMHFRKIESLNLERMPKLSLMNRFLKQYGANLHTLILSSLTGNDIDLEFSAIFDSCPRLEKLRLFNMRKIVDDDTPFEMPYPSLKEFEWEPMRSGNAFLSNILMAATNLEKLVLRSSYFNVTDLEGVNTLITREKILRELTTFHFEIFMDKSYPFGHYHEQIALQLQPEIKKMEGSERLKLTRIRLDCLKKRTSLQKLAIQSIIKDIINPEGKIGKSLRNLSSPMRREVLQTLMDLKCPVLVAGHKVTFQKVLEAFVLLLSPEDNLGTHSLKLDNFLQFCSEEWVNEWLPEIMNKIVSEAPNLRSLAVMQVRNMLGFEGSSQKILKAILKLEMLSKLELASISYFSLMEICKTLRNLNHVDVSFPFCCCFLVGRNIPEFKRTFGLLKVFLFQDVHCTCRAACSSFGVVLYRMCLKYLPDLEVIREYFDGRKCVCVPSILNLPPTESALQHLCVTYQDLKSYWNFPNVTHLKVHFLDLLEEDGNTGYEDVGKFTKIKGLHLENIPSSEYLNRFLVIVGKKLQTLILSRNLYECGLSVDFKTIADSCPQLEKLCLRNVQMVLGCSKNMKPFPSLKELEWQPCRYTRLSKILSAATKLEKLFVASKFFKARDLRKASYLVARKRILRELTTFHFELFASDSNHYQSERIDNNFIKFLKALKCFTKDASAYLPKLLDVKFNFSSIAVSEFPINMNIAPVLIRTSDPENLFTLETIKKLGHPDLALLLKEYRP
ncbi:Hypothetical predicted protein [Cloeon dipterum]|uniref:Uncharacterized protein n=1 Tax=Cloeon dipterum TaxID=197152 RepID=A0A8S1DMJ7_9INSE|nr:Hypothetical predicted protein [Cloeon dipterum]